MRHLLFFLWLLPLLLCHCVNTNLLPINPADDIGSDHLRYGVTDNAGTPSAYVNFQLPYSEVMDFDLSFYLPGWPVLSGQYQILKTGSHFISGRLKTTFSHSDLGTDESGNRLFVADLSLAPMAVYSYQLGSFPATFTSGAGVLNEIRVHQPKTLAHKRYYQGSPFLSYGIKLLKGKGMDFQFLTLWKNDETDDASYFRNPYFELLIGGFID